MSDGSPDLDHRVRQKSCRCACSRWLMKHLRASLQQRRLREHYSTKTKMLGFSFRFRLRDQCVPETAVVTPRRVWAETIALKGRESHVQPLVSILLQNRWKARVRVGTDKFVVSSPQLAL